MVTLEQFKMAIVAVLDAYDDDGGIEAGHEHEIPSDDAACSISDVIDSAATTWGDLWSDLWRKGCDEFEIHGGTVVDWIDRALGMERTNPSETQRRMGTAFTRIAAACRMPPER
jgi:hypothetical protein